MADLTIIDGHPLVRQLAESRSDYPVEGYVPDLQRKSPEEVGIFILKPSFWQAG